MLGISSIIFHAVWNDEIFVFACTLTVCTCYLKSIQLPATLKKHDKLHALIFWVINMYWSTSHAQIKISSQDDCVGGIKLRFNTKPQW